MRTVDRESKALQTRGDEFKEANKELREQNTELIKSLAIVQDFFKKLPVGGGKDVR